MNDKELMKKNYKKLSLVERNAYEQIMERHGISGFNLFIETFYLLIKLVFYFGLFLIMVSVFIGKPPIEFLDEWIMIISAVRGILKPIILVCIGIIIYNLFAQHKLKKELLLKK